jgi:hypothetical protein
MYNIHVLCCDNITLWNNIVANKRLESRNKLLEYKQKVEQRYIFYERNYTSLNNIHPLEINEWEGVKNELISCYGDNKFFNKAKEDIYNNIQHKSKCPYCMINMPNTLDHYFDKEDYPEYSTYLPNIVPCCYDCNNLKGTKMYDDYNHRKFINFYHDRIPSYKFLYIRFEITKNPLIPNINIYLHFDVDDEISRIIKEHYENLQLIKKYKSLSGEKLTELLNIIIEMKKAGYCLDNIINFIEIEYRSNVELYGLNYWAACTYEGILNSSNYLNEIIQN